MDANHNPVWYISPTFFSIPYYSTAREIVTVLEIILFVISTDHDIYVITREEEK